MGYEMRLKSLMGLIIAILVLSKQSRYFFTGSGTVRKPLGARRVGSPSRTRRDFSKSSMRLRKIINDWCILTQNKHEMIPIVCCATVILVGLLAQTSCVDMATLLEKLMVKISVFHWVQVVSPSPRHSQHWKVCHPHPHFNSGGRRGG